jgi:hypothetical protein
LSLFHSTLTNFLELAMQRGHPARSVRALVLCNRCQHRPH